MKNIFLGLLRQVWVKIVSIPMGGDETGDGAVGGGEGHEEGGLQGRGPDDGNGGVPGDGKIGGRRGGEEGGKPKSMEI